MGKLSAMLNDSIARTQPETNCVRLRLSAETTRIFVRDGWLIIESADSDALKSELLHANGERLLSVAEVSERTGFTPGAVRDWIKRSVLAAIRVGKEYRIREAELARLLEGRVRETGSTARRIGRRRKSVSVCGESPLGEQITPPQPIEETGCSLEPSSVMAR